MSRSTGSNPVPAGDIACQADEGGMLGIFRAHVGFDSYEPVGSGDTLISISRWHPRSKPTQRAWQRIDARRRRPVNDSRDRTGDRVDPGPLGGVARRLQRAAEVGAPAHGLTSLSRTRCIAGPCGCAVRVGRWARTSGCAGRLVVELGGERVEGRLPGRQGPLMLAPWAGGRPGDCDVRRCGAWVPAPLRRRHG